MAFKLKLLLLAVLACSCRAGFIPSGSYGPPHPPPPPPATSYGVPAGPAVLVSGTAIQGQASHAGGNGGGFVPIAGPSLGHGAGFQPGLPVGPVVITEPAHVGEPSGGVYELQGVVQRLVRKRPVEVSREVKVPVPVPHHVPIPHPVPVPVPKPVEIPVEVVKKIEVPIEKIEHVVIEKPYPYEVIKHVKVPIIRKVLHPVDRHIVHVKKVWVKRIKEVPIPVPIYYKKQVPVIKHVHHDDDDHGHGGGGGHGWW